MATRNRTQLYRKYQDSLKSTRVPLSSSASTSSGGRGPVIELMSFVNENRSYAPLSTEDPSNSSKGALIVGLPSAWMDLSEERAVNVQWARIKMSELSKAHGKALIRETWIFRTERMHVFDVMIGFLE